MNTELFSKVKDKFKKLYPGTVYLMYLEKEKIAYAFIATDAYPVHNELGVYISDVIDCSNTTDWFSYATRVIYEYKTFSTIKCEYVFDKSCTPDDFAEAFINARDARFEAGATNSKWYNHSNISMMPVYDKYTNIRRTPGIMFATYTGEDLECGVHVHVVLGLYKSQILTYECSPELQTNTTLNAELKRNIITGEVGLLKGYKLHTYTPGEMDRMLENRLFISQCNTQEYFRVLGNISESDKMKYDVSTIRDYDVPATDRGSISKLVVHEMPEKICKDNAIHRVDVLDALDKLM